MVTMKAAALQLQLNVFLLYFSEIQRIRGQTCIFEIGASRIKNGDLGAGKQQRLGESLVAFDDSDFVEVLAEGLYHPLLY